MVLIGIDFGTTYSCVCYYNNGVPEIIIDTMGNKLIPTCVNFSENSTCFGKLALCELTTKPWNTITNIKRLVARNNTNINLQYATELDENGKVKILIKNDMNNAVYKEYYPEQIIGMMLSYLKDMAENYLSLSVTGIVLTAPAYFDHLQKETLFRAARLYNIEIKDIISEPTAAALCYKTDNKSIVLVYDIGGGTLDVTLLECQGSTYTAITKIGDSELGGINFTEVIETFLINEFLSKHPEHADIYKNLVSLSNIRIHADNIKIQLSEKTEINIEIKNFYKKKKLKTTLSRLKFESLAKVLFDKCELCLSNLLKSIGPNLVITDVIFIGGSSRIPNIKNGVTRLINKRQSVEFRVHNNINPDEAVAIGAAKHAFSLSNPLDVNALKLTEILSQNIGIQVGSDYMDVIIEKNTKLPCTKDAIYCTFYNNQVKMRIRLYQGDDPNVKFNKLIGIMEIDKIKPRPKGEVKIKLLISVSKNGMLVVNALEQDSNQEKVLVINDLMNIKSDPCFNCINKEIFKKIKRLIINKNVKIPKYIEFVNSKKDKDIDAENGKELNEILNELLAL